MTNLIFVSAFLLMSQAHAALESTMTTISIDPKAKIQACEETATFSGKAVLFKNDPAFRCDYYDEQRAIRNAEEVVTSHCYQQGYTSCLVRTSYISINGYLGYQEGFSQYLGYGCMASAVVQAGR